MADESVILNPGVGGAAIAVDTIGGISHELVKVEFGSDGTATQVDAAHPLPVTDAVAEAALASIAAEDFATSANQSTEIAALASILAKLSSDPASQTTLAAILAKLIAAPATEAKQDVGNISLASIDTKLTNPLPVSGTVSTGGLTDTQLRATPVPVSFSGSPSVDNTVLYSNTISTTGAISGLDTTGYSSVSIQIGSVWSGNLIIEGCNDNSGFLPLLVLNANELSMTDVIYGNGNYVFKTSTKWIRINVQQITGSLTALVLGRTSLGLSGSDILSFAMDRGNNTPLYVEETANRKDQNNALIPSDAIQITGTVGAAANSVSRVIDTTGYQSIVVQLSGITGIPNMAFQGTNDLGGTWTQLMLKLTAVSSVDATATNANGTFMVPVVFRFFRIINQAGITTLTTFTAYLRQQPVITGTNNVNLTNVGGTAAGTNTGTTGVLAVGGDATVGVTPTTRPLQIGGVDENAAVRRILLDTSGRTRISVTGQDGTSRALSGFSPSTNPNNVPSVAITDVSTTDGYNTTDLLAQLLLEMRINNQYLYELPKTLQIMLNDTQKSISISNEPSEYRNDQSWYQ